MGEHLYKCVNDGLSKSSVKNKTTPPGLRCADLDYPGHCYKCILKIRSIYQKTKLEGILFEKNYYTEVKEIINIQNF